MEVPKPGTVAAVSSDGGSEAPGPAQREAKPDADRRVLPSAVALLWFPVLTFVGMLVLVALGISGSSTGMMHEVFGAGADPNLLAGQPRGVRSDEWLVQASWALSQVHQGFPAVNQTFPGGMDATVLNDLPSTDWSTVFRPHVWGFLLLSPEQGLALRWWLPGWALLAGAYTFVVSLAPRHQVASALVAIATLFSPIVQWWWLPTTLWPVAFGFMAMTAVWWALNGAGRGATWVWALLAAWTGIAMVMSIYVPFMVAALVVAAPFAVGAVLMSRREQGFGRTMRALLPLGVCAAAGLVVVIAWAYTRRDTVSALLSTVYPGARLEPTGSMPLESLKASFGAVWDGAFTDDVTGALGVNESEAATPLMIAPFLAIPLVALVIDRSRRVVNWLAVAALASMATVLAFWVARGWGPLAHLLLLDRSTAVRLRLAFLLLGVVAVAILARAAERRESGRLPWASAVGAVVVTGGLLVWVWLGLRAVADPVLASAWKPVALLVVLGVALVALQRVTWGALALAAASLMLTATVNPLYRGVVDLSQTNVGQAVVAADAADPGTWVGTDGWPTMAVLMQTGVHAFNGIQTYPPAQTWSAIDPAGQYENEWNRLAHVTWTLEPGEPRVSNPQPDVVQVTFDACSSFAQQHVAHLLSREPVTSACLAPVAQTQDGPFQAWVYRVVPRQPTEAAS